MNTITIETTDRKASGKWAKLVTSIADDAKNGFDVKGDFAKYDSKIPAVSGMVILACESYKGTKWASVLVVNDDYELERIAEENWETEEGRQKLFSAIRENLEDNAEKIVEAAYVVKCGWMRRNVVTMTLKYEGFRLYSHDRKREITLDGDVKIADDEKVDMIMPKDGKYIVVTAYCTGGDKCRALGKKVVATLDDHPISK